MADKAPPAPAESILRPNTRLGLVVAIACLAQFMVILDTTIVNVALPDMKRSLDLSIDSQQWVIDGYLITFGGFLLVASRASDVFGRRVTFHGGLLTFVGASLAAGLADSGTLLLVARVIQGLGAAALAPSTLSLITATHDDHTKRARALSLWSAAGASGGGAGLVLGGVLTSALSWRWVLFVNVPIGVAVLIGSVVALAPTPPKAPTAGLDIVGAATATFGFGGLVYSISRAPESGWGSIPVLSGLIASVVVLVGFLVVEHRSANPLIPLAIFKRRTIRTANLIYGVVGAVMTGTLFFLSLYLQQTLHQSALQTGLAMLPWSVAVTASTLASRRLTRALGPRRLLVMAGLTAVVGLTWLATISTQSEYLLHVCAPTVVTATGVGLTFFPLLVIATAVDPHDAGIAAGLFNVARQVGGAIGLAVLVTIAASVSDGLHDASQDVRTVDGYQAALLAAAGLMALATLIAFLVGESPEPVADGPLANPTPSLESQPTSLLRKDVPSMRSVVISSPGGPEVLDVGRRPMPTPGPGQVVIRVAAATVNPTDLLMREMGDSDLALPWTPGMELAGAIEAVGPGADFDRGERVFAIVNPRRPEGGAQSEFVAVPAASVARTPDDIPDHVAAAVPMNGLTALQALRRLGLHPGATLGVLGSAGAVGQYAIQLGVHAGVRVVADARPEDEHLVRSFGAHAIVPRSDRPGDGFRSLVPDGVDGMIDAAAIDSAALDPIRDNGVLATVRMWSGPTERGIRIEPVMVAEDFERTDGLRDLADHLRAGRLTPQIASTYPIERVAEAHARLEAGGVRGRLVLTF